MIRKYFPLTLSLCITALMPAQDRLNDPQFEHQNALFDKLEVYAGWNLVGDAVRAKIGIIDTGFDFYHPDLRGQLEPGFYAANAHHPDVFENLAHGTQVASLIVGRGGNGIGMVGLAPRCTAIAAAYGLIDHDLIRLRKQFAADHPGATAQDFTEEMQAHRERLAAWGARWKDHIAVSIDSSIRFLCDQGVRVINISGSLNTEQLGATHAALLARSFAYAAEHDVVIVIAAGNDGREVRDYPGDAHTTIVVGAILLDDSRWLQQIPYGAETITQGSSYGQRLTVVAPVDELVVCLPHDERFYASVDGPFGPTRIPFRGFCEVRPNGATSSAAPMVSALVALVRSLRPDLRASAVTEIVRRGAVDIGAPGFDVYTGHGRINFRKTLELAKNWVDGRQTGVSPR
jgi:subtilisin family serine protease